MLWIFLTTLVVVAFLYLLRIFGVRVTISFSDLYYAVFLSVITILYSGGIGIMLVIILSRLLGVSLLVVVSILFFAIVSIAISYHICSMLGFVRAVPFLELIATISSIFGFLLFFGIGLLMVIGSLGKGVGLLG